MGGLLSKNERGDYHQWHISPPEQWQAQRPAPSSQKPPNSSPPSNYPSSERNIPPSQDRREWAPAVPRSKPSTDSSLSRETETVYCRLMKFKGFFGLHSHHSGSTVDANSFAEDTPLSPPGRQLSDPSGKDRPTLTSGAPTNVKDIHQAKSASRGTIETNVNSPSRNPGDVRASKAPKPRGHPSVPPPQVSLIGAISRVHYPNENVATGTPVHGADHAETHSKSVHRIRNLPLRHLLMNAKTPTTLPMAVFPLCSVPDTALNGPRCVSSVATTVTGQPVMRPP